MASDDARLLVRIEAQMRQFERAMAKASGTASATAGRIEGRFRAMDRNLSVLGRGLARSLLGPLAALVSAREIAGAADAFTRIQNALAVVGLEGEEAAAVFDKLFASAQKFGAPMEALVDVYRAGALAQKELNISSEELINFTNGIAAALRVSGKSAGESRGALIQLAQAIGSGTVRAEEFNAILEGALPIAQAAARGLEEAGGSVAKLRTLVIDGKVSSEAFFRAFEAGQGTLEALAATTDITLGQAFTRLQNSLIASIGKVDDLTGASQSLVDVMGKASTLIAAVASALDRLAATNPPAWIEQLNSLLDKLPAGTGTAMIPIFGPALAGIDQATEALEALDKVEAAKEAIRQSGPVATPDVIAGPEIAAEADAVASRIATAFAAAGESIEAVQKTVSLKDFSAPTAATGGGGGRTGGRGKSPSDQFAEDIRRMQERTAALNVETAAVGKSTFEAERMLAVQDLLNEAKRAGLTITPELTAAIEQEASAYAAAFDQLEATEERYRGLQEAQSFFAETAFDAFSELIPIIETGNAALDKMLNTLIQAALQAAFLGQGPLATLFGAATRGGPGGIFGKLLGGLFGGARAEGGPVMPGRVYSVGERGPEMFIPSQPGRILPNGAGFGSGAITVNVAGARGNAEIEAMVESGVTQALSAYDKGASKRTRTIIAHMAPQPMTSR